jgi:LytS/YehU family sensor histidine kinase
MNPDFLLNCLHGLRALVVEDPAEAQRMVGRLENLVRYAHGAGSADVVPLARELEVVKDYLELEVVRFRDRLRVTLAVEPESLHARVPVMLVQTLVENGIAELPAGGEITVAARLSGKTLEIDVVSAPVGERRAPGSGLANATERLHVLFGPRASLRVDRSSKERTAAQVRIPRA